MIRRIGILFTITLIATQSIFGQLAGSLTFSQIDSLQKIAEKPIMVFIHTDWCRYCRTMENTTFQDKGIANWLDSAYYLVSLNAEAEEDIQVRGITFCFQPSGQGTGQHELAQALGTVDGVLTFPTLCFLNADYEIIHRQVGLVTANQLTKILNVLKSSL